MDKLVQDNELPETSRFVPRNAQGNTVSNTTIIASGMDHPLDGARVAAWPHLTGFPRNSEPDDRPIADRREGGKRI